MNLNNSDLIVIGEINTASMIIFWFHGYGSNNWSFEPVMKMLNLNMENDVCIIMPNAPYVDNKRSWYPLPTSNSAGTIKEDHDGLRKSKNSINQFIESFKLREEQKIIVGGFSQGAALSLSMLFETDHIFNGCIALSGYMPSAEYHKNFKIAKSDIFIAHGYSDQAISFKDYEKTIDFLSSKTTRITTYTDDFGHTVTKEVNNKILEWLKK